LESKSTGSLYLELVYHQSSASISILRQPIGQQYIVMPQTNNKYPPYLHNIRAMQHLYKNQGAKTMSLPIQTTVGLYQHKKKNRFQVKQLLSPSTIYSFTAVSLKIICFFWLTIRRLVLHCVLYRASTDFSIMKRYTITIPMSNRTTLLLALFFVDSNKFEFGAGY
jgi:hypothetical protein